MKMLEREDRTGSRPRARVKGEGRHALFHHVLVPLDGSGRAEAALPFARAVAAASGARISLLRVAPPAEGEATAASQVDARLAGAEARSYLEEVASGLREAGVDVRVSAEAGPPGETIVRFVRSEDCDLVVVTESGAGRAGAFALGGTSQKVIYGTGVSVLLVRASPERSGQAGGLGERIVALTDGSERSAWAICVAAALARGSSELVLVHALPTGSTSFGRDGARTDLEERLGATLRSAASTYLEDMRERLAGADLEVRTRIVEGPSVTRAIQDALAEERPALAVVSAHGASGPAPWPYGGVATNLLLHSPRSVLVLQDLPLAACGSSAAGAVRPGRVDDS